MQPFALGSTPRSPVTPTGDATPPLSHDAYCTSARRDSGRVRVLVQGPVTNTSSLRGKSRCLLGAKSRRTRHSHGGPRGTDKSHHSPLHHTPHCTAAFAAAAGPELPCLFSSWLPAVAAAAALASAPSATAPSEPTKGPAAGYSYHRHRLLLRRHCHHDWPAQRTRQSLVPSFYRCLVFLMEQPDQTAAASLLHRTCTVFLGHTQTRVDLRFAPLLL